MSVLFVRFGLSVTYALPFTKLLATCYVVCNNRPAAQSN